MSALIYGSKPVAATDYVRAAKDAMHSLIVNVNGTCPFITVRVHGDTAAITWQPDAITLFLPVQCTGMLSRVQADIFTGFWLHETLHFLYTSLSVLSSAQSHTHQLAFPLWNALEDARIEMVAINKGIARNIKPVLSRLRAFNYDKVKQDIQDQMGCLPIVAKLAINHMVGIESGISRKGLNVINPYVDFALDYAAKPEFLHDDGAYKLMLLLLSKLAQEQANGEPCEQGEGEGEQADGEQGEPADGEQGEGEGEGEGEQADGEQGEGEGDGAYWDDSEQADGEPADGDQGEPADSEQADSEQGEGEGAQGDSEQADSDDGAPDRLTGSDNALGAPDGSDLKIISADDNVDSLFGDDEYDFDVDPTDHISELLDDTHLKHADVIDYPDCDDVKRNAAGNKSLELALKKFVKSPAHTGEVNHKKAGKLQRRALTRALAGDQNVHTKRWFESAQNTAVVICTDTSGSMNLGRAMPAATFVFSAVRAFNAVSAPYALINFSQRPTLVVAFNQRLSTYNREKLAASSQQAGGGTNIQRAIIEAVKQHAGNNTPVTRRVIMVVTDGMCSTGSAGVNQAIAYAQESGIKVYGIGIGVNLQADYEAKEKVDQDNMATTGLAMLLRGVH